MGVEERDARIDRWIDTLDIRETLAEYFRALTAGDAARAQAVFLPDTPECHGPVRGVAHGLIAEFVANAAVYRATVRHMLDVCVEIDGDTALSEAGWITILQGEDRDSFYAGRYLDRWQRRDGTWRIAARVAMVDWWRVDLRSDLPFYEGAEEILRFSGRGFEDAEVRIALGLAQDETRSKEDAGA
ncbi:nuclear transport factor 2 family protein [Sphingobium sufflavum]|uniref:nuclear transport factor 2 family protein n=1 Tax=Sphingobium sufflavum TaxID=1129547 RepID=UPI001F2534EA|nr:nuclear transport factor 2 family protein [Sphingobium sufflavum]MCE7796427.1 nuclear transport factor 2 family protein [Sphingobium sufflavum]